jgi:hypothetical protein
MNSKQSTFEGVAELTADSGEQSSRDYKAIITFLAISTTQHYLLIRMARQYGKLSTHSIGIAISKWYPAINSVYAIL